MSLDLPRATFEKVAGEGEMVIGPVPIPCMDAESLLPLAPEPWKTTSICSLVCPVIP